MKNVKKTKRAVSVIAWAAAILILFWWTAPEQRVDRFVGRYGAELEEILKDEPPGIPTDVPKNLGGVHYQYSHNWLGEHPMDEFGFASSAFLHGRQYYGCYYSPDDVPRGFQSVEVTLVPDGKDCWTWRDDSGNHGMTKKITDRWYYFEAWL